MIANCSLFSDPCIGQSAEEFIQMAQDNNPGLRAIKLNYSSAQLKAEQVDNYPDPSVKLGLGLLPVETRLGAQRFKIGASQQIPWKGLLNARKDLALSQAEVYAYMDEVKAIDIAFNIRSAYVTLQYLERKRNILRGKLEILDTLEELAKSSLRSGKGKLSNVLLIQRQRETIESDLDLIEKQKEAPTIMINRWSGRTLLENIDIELDPLDVNNKDSIISFAKNSRPEFQILKNQINASNKAIELTHLESKPKIGVGLEYAWIDKRDGIDISGNGRDILMPMGTITIPLHKGRFDAKRQEEKVKQDAIVEQKRELIEQYMAEIEEAVSKIEYADMEIEKLTDLKTITEEALKLMRTEYSSEGAKFEELLRLEMEMIDYDLIIEKARFEKELKKTILKKFE